MKTRTVQLGDVTTIERVTASNSECQALPYVGLEDIKKDAGNFEDTFRRKPESLLATKFKFTSRHVLYGKLRPYLNKVALPDFEGVCTTEILPLLPKSGVLEKGFLYGLLLSSAFVNWASLRVSGANLPRLGPELLKEFTFELPDLSEQRRIAETLEATDRLRRVRRSALELSDTFLPAVFLHLFGNLRVNSHNWIFAELDDNADIVSGIAKGQKYGDRKTVMAPYLRVANVQDGFLDLSEIKTIQALPQDVESLRLMAGDVVMTEGGDYDKLGRGAIWPGDIPNCIHQNHIFRVRLNQAKVLPTFFAAFLRSPFAKDYFLKCSKQTTNLASINMTQLRATPIPLPSLDKQRHFATLVERHEHLQAKQREALRQAEHLFQTLLQEAFGGNDDEST